MLTRTMSIKTFAAAGMIALLPASVVALQSAHATETSSIDTNADGSISLQEAHDAAAKKFDRLDTEHTGKLTQRQVSPVSKALTEMARHDKDHSIDKTEYMAGVDAAFKEADPKGSGTLSAAALKTKAGKRFLELVE